MAAEYFKYDTTYGNTLVARSDTSFAPSPPFGEIYIDYFIPEIQPLYLYRESGGTIILNIQEIVEEYLEATAPPPSPTDYLFVRDFTEYTNVTAPATYVNVTGDSMTGTLRITGALSTTQRISGLTAYGSSCVYSPIICGTSCAISPITIGSTCVCSPVVFGSVSVCSPTVCSSTCLCSTGTARFTGAVTDASTLNVSGATILGSTLRTIGATTLVNTLNVSGVTRLGTTTCLVSTPAVGSISADRTLFWNPTDKCVKAIRLTGGSDNYYYSENFTSASTTQTTCQPYMGYCPTTFIGGRYQIDFEGAIQNSASNRCSLIAFKLDNVTQGLNFISYGRSTSAIAMTRDVTLTAGTHCFNIYYWSQAGTTTIYYANVRVKRIG